MELRQLDSRVAVYTSPRRQSKGNTWVTTILFSSLLFCFYLSIYRRFINFCSFQQLDNTETESEREKRMHDTFDKVNSTLFPSPLSPLTVSPSPSLSPLPPSLSPLMLYIVMLAKDGPEIEFSDIKLSDRVGEGNTSVVFEGVWNEQRVVVKQVQFIPLLFSFFFFVFFLFFLFIYYYHFFI